VDTAQAEASKPEPFRLYGQEVGPVTYAGVAHTVVRPYPFRLRGGVPVPIQVVPRVRWGSRPRGAGRPRVRAVVAGFQSWRRFRGLLLRRR
jgi:hypothetical protein